LSKILLSTVTVTAKSKEGSRTQSIGYLNNSTLRSIIRADEKIDKSLVETEAIMVTAQTIIKGKPLHYIKDVPILNKLNPVIRVLSTVNQAARFIDNPNWKDGLELGGQLALVIFCPECELMQLGYSMITTTIDCM
jgi:hypothetical protein